MPSDASRLLGDIPRNEADEVDGLLSLSAKSMLFNILPALSDANRVLGETPRDAAEEVDGL